MNVFIVWTKYQARVEGITEDISKQLGETIIVYRENPRKKYFLSKIFLYLIYMLKDFLMLIRTKPKYIFVQVPPQYALIAPLIYKFISSRNIIVIADLHNSALRSPWENRLFSRQLVQHTDVQLVHNLTIFKELSSNINYENQNLIILEDKTNFKTSNWDSRIDMDFSNKNNAVTVFFPASFNLDEPILEVIEAAKMQPTYNFIFTGNIDKLYNNFGITEAELPENVEVTGWVSNSDYDLLMKNCDVLLGLTIFDDIQMSVSNEGLANRKVMVLSDTETLKYLYGNGAVYVKNESISIIDGIHFAINNKKELLENLVESKKRKMERYNFQLQEMLKAVK